MRKTGKRIKAMTRGGSTCQFKSKAPLPIATRAEAPSRVHAQDATAMGNHLSHSASVQPMSR